LLAITATALVARAAEDPGVAEVRAAAARYLQAVEKDPAKAIAEFWTPDGVYVDVEGRRVHASELAKDARPNTGAVAPPPAAAENAAAAVEGAAAQPAQKSEIRMLGPAAALEEGVADCPVGANGETKAVRFLAAWVKSDDRWRLDFLQESMSAAPSRAPLEELGWMVGRWTARAGDAVVDLTVEWTEGRAFLVQHFSVRRGGRELRSGSQRIAWDAAAGVVRSWTFHPDGGFSQSRWRREGDVWIAEADGVLADGRRTSSVHFWTPEGDGACWFKSLEGTVDGQPADDLVLNFSREGAQKP
jgi:ketosteroid isomerase-like protein